MKRFAFHGARARDYRDGNDASPFNCLDRLESLLGMTCVGRVRRKIVNFP
jgi:hypothetical protein